MAIVLLANKKVDLAVSWEDTKQNPARVDGDPVWAVEPPELGALTPTTGASVSFAAGAVGLGRVTATGDGDLGTGIRPVVAVLDVEVVAGEAAVGDITAGAPTDQ